MEQALSSQDKNEWVLKPFSKKKEELINKATALFREKGYRGASMRDLARLLDIEASGLYFHIKNKEEILQIICFRMAERIFSGLAVIEQSELSAIDKVDRLIRAYLDHIMEDVDTGVVFLREWRYLSEPDLDKFKGMRRQYEDRIKAIVQEGIDCGDFGPIELNLVIPALVSSLNWIPYSIRDGETADTSKIKDQLSRFIIAGLSGENLLNKI